MAICIDFLSKGRKLSSNFIQDCFLQSNPGPFTEGQIFDTLKWKPKIYTIFTYFLQCKRKFTQFLH